jgi:hypothetical protein
MQRTCQPPNRAASFAACGTGYWVLRHQHDSTIFRTVPDHCHDRLCLPCARSRAQALADNVAERIDDEPARLVTLTLKADDANLRTRIDRLYRGFRRLRQRPIWKERVTGGAAFLELTRGKHGTHWHVHLHCIVQGKYIPRESLGAEWLAITGDSHVVDVRFIRDHKQTASYVTTYAAKAVPSQVINTPDLIDEAVDALRGRRLVITFGTWRRWRLTARPHIPGYSLFCHSNSLAYRACDPNDPTAAAVLQAINSLPSVLACEPFRVDLHASGLSPPEEYAP